MIFLQDVISQDEIQAFKQYFHTHFEKKYTNWVQSGEVIDYRLTIDENSPEFDVIRRIVSANFSNPSHIWSAYQRQVLAHHIHIDDYKSDNKDAHRYTYILALDSVPEFKAIVWKQTCWDNTELHKFVSDWGKLRRFKKKVSNISETQDLEHTFDVNQQDFMCDYLDLDGIYTYQIGTACLFQATQLHCTSNWTKYKKFPYRELLQIHVEAAEPIAC
jgi:hypothetical protein